MLFSHTLMPSGRFIRREWSEDEDQVLTDAVALQSQPLNWAVVTARCNACDFFRKRTRHQCRSRWLNHLQPGLNDRVTNPWSVAEDEQLLLAHQLHAGSWVKMAQVIGTSRSPLAVKNRYASLLTKKHRWRLHHLRQQTILNLNNTTTFDWMTAALPDDCPV